MIYGKVVGTVWATRKDPQIEGLPLMAVARHELDGSPLDSFVVAVDTVGAGVGEFVLVAQGSSARQTPTTRDRPVDAVIMAIVDNLEVVS
ncbi:MAG: EutN/CcmL family microcompartment protein [Planctomycetota bacterium]